MSDAYWRTQRALKGKPTSKAPAWKTPLCPTCGVQTKRVSQVGPFLEPGIGLIVHVCKETDMQAEIDAFLGADEPPRDGWKRPLIVPAEGGKPVPYTRVSTFAEALNDAGGLVTWKGRMAARGMACSEDLAAMVAGLKFTGDSKTDRPVNKILDGHVETAICRVDDKAAWGTAIHSLTEPDASPFVPARMQADVASYQQALLDHGLECVSAEQFVVNDGLRVAGTFDGIYTHPTLGRLLGDKKTGKLKAQQVALQLAAYAGGELYNWDPAERTPLDVRQDVGLLFHIPKGEGKTEVYLVDLEAGRAAAKAALWVRAWRDRDDLLTHMNELTIGELAS